MLSKTLPQCTLDQSTLAPRHAGTTRYVEAAALRARLEMLSAAGMSRAEIEAASGVNRITLLRLVRGDLLQVTPATAAAIMATEPEPLSAQQHGWVDGTGTRRRLRALAVLGWPTSELARRLENSQSGVRRLMEDGHLCSSRSRARVIALYDELWDQQPAPTKEARVTRRRASARGWWPGLAWDDDTIDDPSAAPANPAPGPAWRRRVEDLEWLLATGEVLATVCVRLGVTRGALERQLRRHRRLDLWVKLASTEAEWHIQSKWVA